jgi:hypothetical protein
MKIEETNSYHLITAESDPALPDDQNFENFLKDFKEKMTTFKKINLILDFSNLINIDLNKILLFSQLSEMHRSANNSFVMVCRGIEFNDLPDEMMAVPTLQEAQDIVEIEDIERDLGI